MAITATMRAGVDWLRELGGAAHNDFFGGTVYWTDDQLLDVLEDWMSVSTYTLYPIDTNYLVYRYNALPHHYLDTVTTSFDGTLIVPTIDRKKRLITFASALTSTTTVTMLGYVYNMYFAAEDLWGRKASQRYDSIALKAGANQFQLQQEYEHCVQKQAYFDSKVARAFKRKRTW